MIRLTVDGAACDLAGGVEIPTGLSPGALNTASGWRTGRRMELTLPATTANRAVFGDPGDLYSAGSFNLEHHTALLEADGVTLLEGTAYLLSRSDTDEGGEFKIRIVCGAPDWAKRAALSMLSAANIGFSMTLKPLNIADTWTGDKAVRFLPVDRGRRQSSLDSESMLPVQQPMLIDDYHPFISVHAAVNSIFEDAGYSVQSRFLNSTFARSLMFSGAFAQSDNTADRQAADFLARRAAEATATANASGIVYATPSMLDNSLGCLFDTADPTALDEQGNTMSDTFAYGGSFYTDADGYACFKPKRTMSVGFMLHLEYRTDFRILNRTRLVGFDRVAEIGNTEVSFTLANSYTDYRANVTPGVQYRAIVFDHVPDRTYAVIGVRSGALRALGYFSARSGLVTMPSDVDPASVYLRYNDPGSTVFQDYGQDWALYAGHVTESGTTAVALDVRLPPREFAGGQAFLLDKFRFRGAEEGMSITVSRNCSLRPYFSESPGYGSTVEFADIVPRSMRQIELLEALQQMFNLVIHTDEREKRVRIEPLEEFYSTDAPTVDWSDRIDHSEPVTFADAGLDVAQWRRYAYLEADAASGKVSQREDAEYGSWRVKNPLYGSTDTSQRIANPLFTTTVNATDVIGSAPSASIPTVVDSGASGDAYIDTPFTTRIVIYEGLHELPQGEIWGYPHDDGTYPLAAFHFPGDGTGGGFTLCFGDRDEVKGLHRYYDGMVERECERQYMTLNLRLSPLDVKRLLTPEADKPSLRSTFRFGSAGRSSKYRLVRLDSYNPDAKSTRCTFIRLKED